MIGISCSDVLGRDKIESPKRDNFILWGGIEKQKEEIKKGERHRVCCMVLNIPSFIIEACQKCWGPKYSSMVRHGETNYNIIWYYYILNF